MSEAPHPALLPIGMHDLLPPEAEIEASVVAQLMATLTAHGYERVKPPLVEFEETLFSGAGAATANSTFRMMDPISHRMIGVRADVTPQISRIAATRFGRAPRPLRLSYAGQVLRVRGSEIRPERQIGQVGAELIGAAGPAADVEVIAVASAALAALGVPHLTVDITLPTLVPTIAEAYAMGSGYTTELRAALDHKDTAAVIGLAGRAGKLLERLILAAGPAAATLAALDKLDLPEPARAERARLCAVVDGLTAVAPELKVTVDPVENRGFEYHTGVSFTFFAVGTAAHSPLGELGRGGRYDAGEPGASEPATGFTLYTDTILSVLPEAPAPRRVLLPLGADRGQGDALRAAGWVTLAALEHNGDWRAEARRLGCSHILEGESPVALSREGVGDG
jgi:ATP phosphoribosyltransferase regulatory subunit